MKTIPGILGSGSIESEENSAVQIEAGRDRLFGSGGIIVVALRSCAKTRLPRFEPKSRVAPVV